VPPEDRQEPGDILGHSAVRFFIERMRTLQSDFAQHNDNIPAIAAICRRLDGIPLAIELAAARLRAISVTELEARLDQRFSILTGGSRAALPASRRCLPWSTGPGSC